MNDIIIPNPEKLQEKIEKFKAGGVGNMHVRSNFDGSLTLTYLNGKKLPSIIARLRQGGGYISEDYAKKSQELSDYYRPIEYDMSITIEEKRAKMLEWWTRHYALLKEVGLSRQVLDKLTENERGNFRVGTDTLLKTFHENGIPMVILSSSGIGNTIPMFLRKDGLLFDNISVLTNEVLFDESGKMTGVAEPIIHSYNKNEIAISQLPNYAEIEKRTNVLIMGDTLGDLKMVEGFDYDEVIAIGFLIDDVEKNLEDYKKGYDVVILGDSNMDYVNELMGKILG